MGCLMASGEPADTEIAFGTIFSTSNAAGGFIMVFSGVDTTTPMDVTPTTATATGSRHPDPPAITPSTSGAAIVSLGGASTWVSTQTCSNMTNMLWGAFDGDSWRAQGGMSTKMDWSSGAFDPAAWTGGSNSGTDGWGACTVALRPAVVGVRPVLVGSAIQSYNHAMTTTIPLNSGLTGGSRNHIAVGDIVVAGLACTTGGGGDIDLTITTAGYTEVCDLFVNSGRRFNFATFYKIITAA